MFVLVFVKLLKTIAHWKMSRFFYWFYGRPARKLIVIAVTGTKGKSTTCRLIASILEAAGHKVGMMTTVEFQIKDRRWPNKRKMTMLGRGEIQKMLKKMVKAGCRYAVVEVSSEGILQHRHYGLLCDLAVFTNLSPEHVEAHGGFENLKKDKGKIFSALKKYPNKIINGQKINKIIIANIDDDSAKYYLNFPADEKIAFGLKNVEVSDSNIKVIKANIISSDINGSTFQLSTSNFQILIPGLFNVYNALAAITVGRSQKISDEQITAGLTSVKVVEGRMEFIKEGQKFNVVVDYAHEPVSLEELFKTLRGIILPENKIIAIVGSDGGGRDKQKRVKMGELAGQMADYVIITDVNCFNEDPRDIAEMLAEGVRKAGKKDNENLFVEINRRKAIAKAFSLAEAGDAVAITAKGTEPCIVAAGGKKIPWDDRVVAREELTKLLVTNF